MAATPSRRAPDFFAAKGAARRALLDALRVDVATSSPATRAVPASRAQRRACWPAASDVGWLGELHPLVARAWDLDHAAARFELDLDARRSRHADAVPRYVDLTSFPAVRQDLAVVVADDVPAARRARRRARRRAASCWPASRVFDLYRGEQVGEGRKSLALRLAFRAADRTLTDEEVAPAARAIVAALRDELGGELRG